MTPLATTARSFLAIAGGFATTAAMIAAATASLRQIERQPISGRDGPDDLTGSTDLGRSERPSSAKARRMRHPVLSRRGTGHQSLTSRSEFTSSARYRSFDLIFTTVAAAAGGYVTATLSPANAILHALMLALALLLLSALSALQMKGKQPVLYQMALIALSPLGVFAGGMLRLKQQGLI